MTTTDQLENALAFAKSDKHEGEMRVILAQAKAACRTLTKEVERLHETNQRLNRRAQKMESTHHDHWWDEYQRGYQEGVKGSSEVKRFRWIAQRHGEKNAKLKAEVERLRAALSLACTPPFKTGGTPGVCDDTLAEFYLRQAAQAAGGDDESELSG